MTRPLALRRHGILQGLSGGFIIPLLLTIGIRVLTPEMRLYALAAYALTATFAPNISVTMAALWDDLVNWQFVFLQDIPLFTLAGVLAWYGLPHDEPNYARLKKFDWPGALLIIIAAFSSSAARGAPGPTQPLLHAHPGAF